MLCFVSMSCNTFLVVLSVACCVLRFVSCSNFCCKLCCSFVVVWCVVCVSIACECISCQLCT